MLGVKLVVEGQNGKAVASRVGQYLLIIITTVLTVYSVVRWGLELKVLLVNFAVALIGSFLAIEMMIYAYRRLDRLTAFDTSEQLKADNRAVGNVVGGLFIGIGIVIGLIVALGVS